MSLSRVLVVNSTDTKSTLFFYGWDNKIEYYYVGEKKIIFSYYNPSTRLEDLSYLKDSKRNYLVLTDPEEIDAYLCMKELTT